MLIVEDDEVVRLLEVTIFESAGNYEVAEAAGGAEAIEALKSRPVDLVLLDLLMPGVNGWGVLEFIGTLPEPPRVIVVTGMHEVVAPGHLRPFVAGYVTKPFRTADLLATCGSVLATPALVDARGTRRSSRRTFVVDATLLSDAGQPLLQGRLLQFSQNGFAAEIGLPVRLDDVVTIAFSIPGRDQPLRVKGRVRWQRDFKLGAEFDELSPDVQAILGELFTEA